MEMNPKGDLVAFPMELPPDCVPSFAFAATGETGPFKLEVEWVKVFREETRYDPDDQDQEFTQLIDTLNLSDEHIGHVLALRETPFT